MRGADQTDEADHSEQNLNNHMIPNTRAPLHSFIPTTLPSRVEVSDTSPSDTRYSHVYPSYPYELAFQELDYNVWPAEREILVNGIQSNQFPYIDLPYEFNALPPQTLAPNHRSVDDPTLLPGSIKKRLRFRPEATPVPCTSRDTFLGSILFEAHCRAYERNPEITEKFDPILFAECISLNEYNSLTSKTQEVIQANAFRSDPDWRHTVVRIFTKTQQKINEGSIFGDWKACQTLALMHDAVLLIFGPVVKYLEALDKRDCPDNIFIYGGKTPQELSDYAAKHLPPGEKRMANDYTAYDQSQGREAQVLEELRMRRAGIPEDLIAFYVRIKCNLECQFGPLTSMRFTGEPGTYRFNSDYNLAVIFIRHDVPRHIPVFISGDDSLIGCVLPIRAQWNQIAHLFTLRFKLEVMEHGLFCGYYLSHVGAVRSPLTLIAKLMVATADGSLDLKLTSYLSEFNIGHQLGDELWKALPVDQVRYQSACYDFFLRNCSRADRVSLQLGEIPTSFLSRAWAAGIQLGSATYAKLSNFDRHRFLRLRRMGLTSSQL